MKRKKDDIDYEGSASGLFLRVGAGYIWHWESFNLSLGGVWTYVASGNVTLKDSTGTELDETVAGIPNFGLDFMLGFAF